eukprot:TRINITY_DN1152_c0_g1_i10.p1 TRINITY_DN1152_c0_g1~~TRINITY_DN1152_c0_g1_i10.p1  ORF type:complete len:144 (-),score=46.95 TRINITY_DN1152_c0_g1_i10:36-467(-)
MNMNAMEISVVQSIEEETTTVTTNSSSSSSNPNGTVDSDVLTMLGINNIWENFPAAEHMEYLKSLMPLAFNDPLVLALDKTQTSTALTHPTVGQQGVYKYDVGLPEDLPSRNQFKKELLKLFESSAAQRERMWKSQKSGCVLL